MKINFLKASWSGGLHSHSRVVRQGGHTSVVETRVTGDDGEVRAVGTATFLILDRALRPPR